jgi:hypothetical protein
VRALLVEVAALDPDGPLGRGLARFGSWRALTAIAGTEWLPLPRRPSAATRRIARQRLRALGAEPVAATLAEVIEAAGPVQLQGTCGRLPGTPAGALWRASVVEEADGAWAVEEGEDFVLRDTGGHTTLVVAEGGRLVNANLLSDGDEVVVFGVGGQAPDRGGLASSAYGRGGLIPAVSSDPTHPLLVSVIRRYDQQDDAPQD